MYWFEWINLRYLQILRQLKSFSKKNKISRQFGAKTDFWKVGLKFWKHEELFNRWYCMW